MYETGKAAQVEREMSRYNISILGVSECRWTGNGMVTTSSNNTILYSGRDDNHHAEGVAIILNPMAKKGLIGWKPINERIITARFNSRHTKMTIIQCYAPTNEAQEETKDIFYQQLQKTINEIPKHDLLLLIGDLNAKVGRNNEGRERTMGTHGCGDMNENGELLADLCGMNDFVIGGTIFPHREIHKKTWISPNRRDKNQIDHIIINGRWRHSLQDVIVRRGADVGSDHHLLPTKIKLHLKRVQTTAKSTQQRFDTAKLKDPTTRKKFSLALRNKYQVLGDIGQGLDEDVETTWNSIKEGYIHACKTVLGKKRRGKPKSGLQKRHGI